MFRYLFLVQLLLRFVQSLIEFTIVVNHPVTVMIKKKSSETSRKYFLLHID